MLIGKILMGTVDGALAVIEAGAKTYDRGKRLLKGLRGKPAESDETPVPLTRRDVDLQQAQISSATSRRDEIRPPPRLPAKR